MVTAGIAESMSASTVRRILSQDAIKPWQHRSWIYVRDPDFAVKAKRVLDLYARTWEGEPLGEHDYVISCDEKTSIQARCRCHPTLPPGRSRTMRVDFTDLSQVENRLLAIEQRFGTTASRSTGSSPPTT